MDKQIKLATFTYPYEMDLVRTMLESDGIQCFTRGENDRFHDLTLNVLESDLQKAISIVNSTKIQINEDSEIDVSELNENIIPKYSPENKIQCPRCNSYRITPFGIFEKMVAFSIMFFGYPKNIRTWIFFCFNCKTEFEFTIDNQKKNSL